MNHHEDTLQFCINLITGFEESPTCVMVDVTKGQSRNLKKNRRFSYEDVTKFYAPNGSAEIVLQ